MHFGKLIKKTRRRTRRKRRQIGKRLRAENTSRVRHPPTLIVGSARVYLRMETAKDIISYLPAARDEYRNKYRFGRRGVFFHALIGQKRQGKHTRTNTYTPGGGRVGIRGRGIFIFIFLISVYKGPSRVVCNGYEKGVRHNTPRSPAIQLRSRTRIF